MKIKMQKAQSILEYVILIIIVVSAIGAMRMYLLRSVKAQFKVVQESVSDEYSKTNVCKAENGVVPPGCS